MLRIFDNLELGSSLLPALQETLALSSRADFCVGYFNLRGWGGLAPYVDDWSNDNGPCRVLIGMQRLPHEELREAFSLLLTLDDPANANLLRAGAKAIVAGQTESENLLTRIALRNNATESPWE